MSSATVQMKVRPEDLSQVPKSGERVPNPGVLVIFGASGDLTKRKLLPALYHLEQNGLLPKEFAVVGVARRPLGDEFAKDMRDGIVAGGGVDENDPKLGPFIDRVKYHPMNFDDDGGYDGLKTLLAGLDKQYGTKGNRLFYLATSPDYFADIINHLGAHGMNKPVEGADFVRTIIEKPFGHDLDSAR